jgi:carbamoyltransferase
MIVLGICDSQDAGAALFHDGRLIAAVNEERLNRKKLWGGFPELSIAEVLRLAHVRPDQVEAVILGTRITPNLLVRMFRGIHQDLRKKNGQFGYLLNLFITYQTVARRLRLPEALEAAAARRVIARDLARVGVRAPVHSIDHHLAHAAAAWGTCPFERALVVTVDGLGDGLGVTVSVGERGHGLTRVHEETGFSSLTLYYSRLTQALGFTPIKDEGKVNGLAAYTTETPALHLAEQLLRVEDGRFELDNHLLPASLDRPPWSELKNYTREQVAASFQTHLEHAMRDFVRTWLARTGTRHVAVAGGLFANVKLNQRLATMPEVDEVYVFPHMGDGGLAVGGALAWLGADPQPLSDVFLGPAYDDARLEQALQQEGLAYTRPADLADEVARILASGRIVGRLDGRMEYGPRALGNRTILAPANDPALLDALNAMLKRSPFMPFAPILHDDLYAETIVDGHKGWHASEFMTISFDVTPRLRDTCRGGVHVDDTARPQRVVPAVNPGLAAILAAYTRRTGLPALINTSFNLHEEPIVCSPEDAVSSYVRAGLGALVLGPYLVERPTGVLG